MRLPGLTTIFATLCTLGLLVLAGWNITFYAANGSSFSYNNVTEIEDYGNYVEFRGPDGLEIVVDWEYVTYTIVPAN